MQQPTELILLIDHSGSMLRGQAERIAEGVCCALGENDLVNVVAYDHEATLMSPKSIPASLGGKYRVGLFISELEPGGGTDLNAALLAVRNMPSVDGFRRSVIIVTDN
jgi:uncharacterized protein with von Willebrand factor type A (vWA) domain